MVGTRTFLNLLLSWSLATLYIEALANPVIRFEPEQTAYIVGERLIMRCVIDNPTTVTGYTFYKDAAPILNSTSNILTLSNLKTSDSGMFFCSYYMENERKPFSSNPIDLKVFEKPPAPSLFVMPQRIAFVKDQSAVLRCQLPAERPLSVTGITLYQNTGPTYDSDNFGVLNYTKLQIQNTGNYSCGYAVSLSGRIIESYHSKEVILIVIEQLQTPRLRYAYRNQNLSQQVELACEVGNPSFSQINGYHFFRNGINIASTQLNSFTFNYTLIFDGCYSCRTFVKILGDEILSLKSFEQFLSADGRDERQCQESMSKGNIFSTQGLKFYGSILAGKLLVLVSVLAIFGVYILVIQQRKQKATTESQ